MLLTLVILYLLITIAHRPVGGQAGQEHRRLRDRRPAPAADHDRDDHVRDLVRLRNRARHPGQVRARAA